MSIIAPPDLDKPLNERYTITTEKIENGEGFWSYTKVHVLDNGVEIFDYLRRYSSMYKTFEPFRQYRDGAWKNYALISSDYTTFQVVDLEKGEVVATRPPVTAPWFKREEPPYNEYEDMLEKHPDWFEDGGYYAGVGPDDEKPVSGFCPVEFYVPDYAANYGFKNADQWDDWIVKYAERNEPWTGEYALYSGCYWGDDSSWKLRYIDLSRISEGIVTEDDRFGYVSIAGKVRDIDVYENGVINVPVEVQFDLKTGEGSKWVRDEIKWAKTDDD